MTFQEMLRADLDHVFFNAGEMASEHEIDGKKMVVILKEEDLENARAHYRSTKNTLNPKENAINKQFFTVRIRESDVNRKFTSGAMITVDGKRMFVADVKHQRGVCVLTIEGHMV